ncbi:sigma-54 dependent transcriptional regulator [Motiliproteus sp. MSK22-1]|uniref:sigma-54-dependent transcriptional regulator n=1 Tax=Motiliproteus sp. MSK22-1 TaxID=1897630 RepID=UPI000975E182|nr:sigma-54 dependent transcriptional regulator [Motiliproteus sp. MSK22-1]OMH33624.1 sigma-54-dependent Fis family transcriptional regulator [Motiliproteus sp. MSK22-1]
MAKSLLIIEDEALLSAELQRHYKRQGWRVEQARDLAAARKALYQEGVAPLVVLADMNLPDGNSMDVLEESRNRDIGGEWIFLTGYGSVSDSVRALRLGAYDFLEKPVDFDRLDLVVSGAARSSTAQRRLSDQLTEGNRRYPLARYVGSSAAARQVRDMLSRLAEAPITSLIVTGETGTGKGVAARILHHSGPRRKEPLVEVNCSALPKDLLESELFGHEAGAFTGAKGKRRGLFEQADGGTLFLDEIGEIPVELQPKLLKALEEQRFRRVGGEREIKVDVQVIAATNRDLVDRIKEGDFREDLYHRLCVFELRLPALRDRLEDLDELVPQLVDEFNAKSGKRVSHISPAVWDKLKQHSWPGNVRELRNVIERCILFADGSDFPLHWLQLSPHEAMSHSAPATVSTEGAAEPLAQQNESVQVPLDGSMGMEDIDRFIIVTALERSNHNVTAAARLLNTTRDTLRYRISKYDIDIPDGV